MAWLVRTAEDELDDFRRRRPARGLSPDPPILRARLSSPSPPSGGLPARAARARAAAAVAQAARVRGVRAPLRAVMLPPPLPRVRRLLRHDHSRHAHCCPRSRPRHGRAARLRLVPPLAVRARARRARRVAARRAARTRQASRAPADFEEALGTQLDKAAPPLGAATIAYNSRRSRRRPRPSRSRWVGAGGGGGVRAPTARSISQRPRARSRVQLDRWRTGCASTGGGHDARAAAGVHRGAELARRVARIDRGGPCCRRTRSPPRSTTRRPPPRARADPHGEARATARPRRAARARPRPTPCCARCARACRRRCGCTSRRRSSCSCSSRSRLAAALLEGDGRAVRARLRAARARAGSRDAVVRGTTSVHDVVTDIRALPVPFPPPADGEDLDDFGPTGGRRHGATPSAARARAAARMCWTNVSRTSRRRHARAAAARRDRADRERSPTRATRLVRRQSGSPPIVRNSSWRNRSRALSALLPARALLAAASAPLAPLPRRSLPAATPLHCYAYAPPACADAALAELCEGDARGSAARRASRS